jgi:hypothetical protein
MSFRMKLLIEENKAKNKDDDYTVYNKFVYASVNFSRRFDVMEVNVLLLTPYIYLFIHF